MALYQARKQFPSAKLYLWCHDMFGGPGWDAGFKVIIDTQAVPIVVSDWHKQNMYDTMSGVSFSGFIPCRRIYNPIEDSLKPDETPVDSNKLVFFSSPHKGLIRTLEVFERFRDFEELCDIKLYVANPGYFPDADLAGIRNVVSLGALPHHEIIQHVRSAFAVFHLNHIFPETMGIVHAEANAVGTPFLNGRIGAVAETADHPGELVDVTDNRAAIDRILSWRKGRPKVRGNPNFKLSKIVKEWENLLAL
jgi:glycosyltransferase involved in cell wall biosynthesis